MATTVRGRRHRQAGRIGPGEALLWLGPALALIIGVVFFPAVMLVDASLARFSITGLRTGAAGLDNYVAVLTHPMLPTVLTNTVLWVVLVVAITIVTSLAIAQFASKQFLGRRVLRTALILPWAASLVITSQVFVLLYDYNYGLLNPLLVSAVAIVVASLLGLAVGIARLSPNWLLKKLATGYVESVRTVNQKGKVKRFGRSIGRRDHVKKAYVSLKKGHELNFSGETA